MRVVRAGFVPLTLALAAGLLVANPAVADPQGKFLIEVDVDGNGKTDEVMLSVDDEGERTRLTVVTDTGVSSTATMPWRDAPDVSPGRRLEGVAPVANQKGSDVVVRMSSGKCTRYRIWNWAEGTLSAVPKPKGGLTWRVCGLGAEQKGQGFRVRARKQTPKLVMYRGELDEGGTALSKTRYRWQGEKWNRKGQKIVTDVRPEEVLDRWRLDFRWRTS